MYLRSQPSRVPTPRCRGFTIAEMVVAIFLTALLAVLMAAAAAAFARPAAEVDGRTRLALEASMAVEALARDLGGYLADNSGNPGNLTQYKFSNWYPSSDNKTLFLSYQGTTYTYQQQNNELVQNGLVRTLLLSNPTQYVVVASHVTDFNASYSDPGNPATSNVIIEITFTYPDPPSNRLPSFSAIYVLKGVLPPQ